VQQPQYRQPTPLPQPAQRQQPTFNNASDDLDIPPFLRNRRK
jgi:cell division protein FtsZ